MTIPVLTPVTSSRFAAWFYDKAACELWVQFPPSKRNPSGSLYVYSDVDPMMWEDALEAPSKGEWLGKEVIARSDRHPYRKIEDFAIATAQLTETETATVALTGNAAQMVKEGVPLSIGYRGDNLKVAAQPAASMADMETIPEPIREAVPPPRPAVPVMPEILPPDVPASSPAVQKPFHQFVRERSQAVLAALPTSLLVRSPEQYRALGAALVVVQTERRAVQEAFDLIARPLIDAKRALDSVKNSVLENYETAETHLAAALGRFRREEEQRARAAAEAERRRRQAEADADAKRRADAIRAENERQAEGMRKQAEERKLAATSVLEAATAQSPTVESPEAPTGVSAAFSGGITEQIIRESQLEIAAADRIIEEATELASAPVESVPQRVGPVGMATPDLKVAGLRSRAPKWKWEIDPKILRQPIEPGEVISRSNVVGAEKIPDEYWILDEKALNGVARSLNKKLGIHGINVYDANERI